ncbi:DUF4132 domain-containing protein [Enterobacillus tribolii]|uniref:Uncharacterized protein DUF4132 n=1 Tax=Enterobacillus tribolii TaxID=1487935 RepID=A0A370QRW5_9GAMM|nr:DUF4132 domain-containing protein [Enterobacillus tribolii]MBW7983525.1 DUF4132 domain-containing protein [Enterobacillus tribolii]RDK91976.1 uncharacterized protein DUF4132 [Enterobacillus tribolii]
MSAFSPFTWLLACLNADASDLPRPGSPLPDLSELSAEELGALWPAAYRQRNNFDSPAQRELAYAVLEYGWQHRLPALGDADALALFRQLHAWDEAVQSLAWLTQAPCAGLAGELERILTGSGERRYDDDHWARHRYQAFCLSAFVDKRHRERLNRAVAAYCENAPYAQREFSLLPQLAFSSVLALASSQTAYYHPREQDEWRDPLHLLSEEPAYLALAQALVTEATERINDIQRGAIPYVADGAFPVEDAHVIARMVRVAAWRDEAWLGALIERLLPGAAAAPASVTAKTLPSQSLTVALGHAVEGVPTPEGVRALRAALNVTRHAGINKKLARNLKPAERALAQRPETALRLGDLLPAGKRGKGVLATCLEACLWQETTFSVPEWREKLLESPAAGTLVRTLIWCVQTPGQAVRAFLPERNGKFVAADGTALAFADEERIALWHPLYSAQDERDAWQARIMTQRLAQPFRQAFREYYFYDEQQDGFHAGAFSGYQLALRPLLGLAGREGWHIGGGWDDGVLVRRFGAFRAEFHVGARLYPGVQGWGASGEIRFLRQEQRGWEAVDAARLPPVLFSEICRAVDLLVSRAGIAAVSTDDDGLPAHHREKHLRFLSQTGRIGAMRREVLHRLFAGDIAAGRLGIARNQASVGEYAINLTTGRVTRAGAPVKMDVQQEKEDAAPVFWLPYDENLLKQICVTLRTLLLSTY